MNLPISKTGRVWLAASGLALIVGIHPSIAKADVDRNVQKAWAIHYIYQEEARCLRQKSEEIFNAFGRDSDVGKAVAQAVNEREATHREQMMKNEWAVRWVREQNLEEGWLDPDGSVKRRALRLCRMTKSNLVAKELEVLGRGETIMYWPNALFGIVYKTPKNVVVGLARIPQAVVFAQLLANYDGPTMAAVAELTEMVTENLTVQLGEWKSSPKVKALRTAMDVENWRKNVTAEESGEMIGGAGLLLATGPTATGGLVKGLTKLQNLPQMEALAARNAFLEKIAFRDPLTNAFTEAALNEGGPLSKPIAAMLKSGEEVYALKIDVDFLKAFNDLVGHTSGGNVILQKTAEDALVAASLRNSDILIRSGKAADEFLIIIKTDREGALTVAERLRELRLIHPERQELAAQMLRRTTDGSVPRPVVEGAFRGNGGVFPHHGNLGTSSIGIAKYEPGETLDAFLARADEALAKAKMIPGKAGIHID